MVTVREQIDEVIAMAPEVRRIVESTRRTEHRRDLSTGYLRSEMTTELRRRQDLDWATLVLESVRSRALRRIPGFESEP